MAKNKHCMELEGGTRIKTLALLHMPFKETFSTAVASKRRSARLVLKGNCKKELQNELLFSRALTKACYTLHVFNGFLHYFSLLTLVAK